MNKAGIEAILTSEGKIFSALFIKKDGELRRLTGRLGVKKGITGKGLAFNPYEKGLLPVYDMEKNEYRMININTLLEVKLEGKVYRFND